MLKAVDFEVLQGRYVKAAMDKNAAYRPDGKFKQRTSQVVGQFDSPQPG